MTCKCEQNGFGQEGTELPRIMSGRGCLPFALMVCSSQRIMLPRVRTATGKRSLVLPFSVELRHALIDAALEVVQIGQKPRRLLGSWHQTRTEIARMFSYSSWPGSS